MRNTLNRNTSGKNRQHGFTLIEVLTVVLIIGILAGLAFPQYARFVMQSRRADAMTALSQTRNLLQKYYTECGEYPTGFGVGNPVYNCAARTVSTTTISPDTHYVLTIVTVPGPAPTNAPNQGYTLTATPRLVPAPASPQVGDTDCGAFAVDDAGRQTVTGAFIATPERCWRR